MKDLVNIRRHSPPKLKPIKHRDLVLVQKREGTKKNIYVLLYALFLLHPNSLKYGRNKLSFNGYNSVLLLKIFPPTK